MTDHIQAFLDVSPKANPTYKSHLTAFGEWVDGDVTDVTLRDLKRYFNSQEDEYADKTLQTRYSAISALYAFLEDDDEIETDGDPTESFDISDYAGTQAKRDAEDDSEEDHIYLPPDEVEELAENVPTKDPLRNELIVRLLFETGLRVGELSRVKLENIDRENGDILVKTMKKRHKTERRTVHWYGEATEMLLTQWLDKGHREGIFGASESPYLFPTPKRDRIREQAVNDIIKQAAESAGLQEKQYEDAAGRSQWKITAHTLRHSCAMHLLNNGATIAHVKKLLGHADIQTTQQYMDPSADNTRKVVNKLRDP